MAYTPRMRQKLGPGNCCDNYTWNNGCREHYSCGSDCQCHTVGGGYDTRSGGRSGKTARERNRRRLRPVPQCEVLTPVGSSIMTGYTIYQTSLNPGGSYIHSDDETGEVQI